MKLDQRSGELLITVASWEDRFVGSFERSLNEGKFRQVLMFFVKEYEAWSDSHRRCARTKCKRAGIDLIERPICMEDPVSSWSVLREAIKSVCEPGSGVMVDITTAPREVIWAIFWHVESCGGSVRYVYQLPESYNEEWLSRDPGVPRLVFKLSGIADPLKRSLFVGIVGFDIRRTARVIRFFEPERLILGLQSTGHFEVNARRMAEHAERFGDLEGAEIFEIDAYADDHGEKAILARLAPYKNDFNVIVTSLGPKPSAVALYRIQRRNQAIALAYAPARDFNREYSHGMGARIHGQVGRKDEGLL